MGKVSEQLEHIQHDVWEWELLCEKLVHNWYKVKKMEVEQTDNRDATFIKELVYAIEYSSILIQVLAEQGQIHPNYAVEKLKVAKSYIDAAMDYFKGKENYNEKI